MNLKHLLGALLGGSAGAAYDDNSLRGALLGAGAGAGLQHGGKALSSILKGGDDVFASAKGAQQFEDVLSHTLKRDGSNVVSMLDKVKPDGLTKIHEGVQSFGIPVSKYGEVGLSPHNRELYKTIGLRERLLKNENRWDLGENIALRGFFSEKPGIDKIREVGKKIPMKADMLVL